ncbi:LysR family transcriptional regulator [Luteibacter sp. OK325]|uniref:LysR family transcriptional regulator n=1 Tax=Luteibacter sp. OK325 TaxID=2135670 RepID=UPI000D3BAE37|nr:LysR family transcriptional regulator [Luteibacter sp. OK325]PTR34081.1 LysR family transcriptional regulator [Luteibacter sp. OK325]
MSDSLHKLSWDDLRIVKAIGESSSLAAAATLLGVNNSTISRRLSALEEILGVALFDRRRSGYVPTSAGVELVALGERVEKDVVGVVRRVSGNLQTHRGDLRITTSDALLLDFLTPIIASFQMKNPEVRIEVIVANEALNLARGDSDVAFRATLSPPENLFGRKVATVAWATYGRKTDYAHASLPAADLYTRHWVSYGKRLCGLRAFRFVEDRVSQENIRYRSDSVTGVAAGISAGMGIGILPCMHGDLVPGLMRIGPIESEIFDELWILTHPDIRKAGRVFAFMSHCAEMITLQRDFIAGRGVHAGPTLLAEKSSNL